MMAVLLAQGLWLHAQTAPLFGPIPLVSVSIALQNDRVLAGKGVRVALTIRNPSHQEIVLSNASHLFRIHVEGKDGESNKTEWNRHLHGDVRQAMDLT
jgi:hypothetical protein